MVLLLSAYPILIYVLRIHVQVYKEYHLWHIPLQMHSAMFSLQTEKIIETKSPIPITQKKIFAMNGCNDAQIKTIAAV